METNHGDVRRSASWETEGEMVTASSQRSAFFRRDLVQQDDRWLIQSICRNCGMVIVGSVSETLAEDEENHILQCSLEHQFPAAG